MMAGDAVTVTLLPEPEDKFTLLCANVEMLDVPVDNSFSGTVNGWFKPRIHTVKTAGFIILRQPMELILPL